MRPHFTPGDCKWFKTVPVPWTLKKIITMETENPTNLSDHSYAAITFHRSPTETKLMDRLLDVTHNNFLAANGV